MNTWYRRKVYRGRGVFRPQLEVLEDRCLLTGYVVTNLASDIPGLARVTDPNLVNPWGISFSPTGAFWLAENGAGVSDLLDGNGAVQPLVVPVPGVNGSAGSPSGTVFNGGRGFLVAENGISDPSLFLFATENGTISGWDPVVDPTHSIVAVNNSASGAVYKGLALATDPSGHTYLYAANFHSGAIDVFNENFQPVSWAGAFQDPALPAGYAPFNIQNINGLLYVTYAKQDQAKHDDVPGAGSGFIDVYTPDGALVQHLVSGGPLNSPWGLALAPANFGAFSGDLLVGNNGDGHINAFNPRTGAYLGPLTDRAGTPITIPGLWGLAFGNGHQASPSNELFFTAGIDSEQHGLFGAIRDPSTKLNLATAPVKYNPDNLDDEYPLPPDNGPAMQSFAASAGSVPMTVLASSDSSLLLAPTLSTSPQLSSRTTFAPGQSGATPSGGPATVSTLGVWMIPSANTSAVSPLVVGPLTPGSTAGTSLIPLNAFFDVNAVNPSGQSDTAAGESIAGLSAVAAIESPVAASVVEEGRAPSEGSLVQQPEKPASASPAALVEARAEEATAAQEPSGRFLHTLLLGKLVLVSTAALAWYYLPAGNAGPKESDRQPAQR